MIKRSGKPTCPSILLLPGISKVALSMKKNAIIVGMPRSGTSLTTSIFTTKGYFAASPESGELRKGDEYNPLGYFEAQTLINANSRVFSRIGFPHDNTWLYSPLSNDLAREIHNLKPLEEDQKLVSFYNQHSPWVWKDPRLCYTLAYWSQLIDWDQTCVLLLKRKPSDIYRSFMRLGWRTPGRKGRKDVHDRVEEHIQFAESTIQRYGLPHITIDYADFEKRPHWIRQQLADHFGLELEPEQLNYSRSYNHSTLKGKISTVIKIITDRIPLPLVKLGKALLPRRILRWLFPEKSL